MAPILAIRVVIGAKIRKAGMFTNPKLKGALTLRYFPEIIKPQVPIKETKKPNAAEQPNAVIQCTATGMLETVTCMDDKLETIQKSLDSFPTYPFLTQGN